jgi:hypothetical protein
VGRSNPKSTTTVRPQKELEQLPKKELEQLMSDKGEDDVARDPQVATSRATGGTDAVDDSDQASTTGTSDTPEYVGRIAGDDVGYAGETGAERRSEARRVGGLS